MIHSTLLFLSAPDITVIVVIALFLFGGKKIPEFARGLGKGIREFKDAQSGVTNDSSANDNNANKA
jgi:sec-independent protein translocase protein TatA